MMPSAPSPVGWYSAEPGDQMHHVGLDLTIATNARYGGVLGSYGIMIDSFNRTTLLVDDVGEKTARNSKITASLFAVILLRCRPKVRNCAARVQVPAVFLLHLTAITAKLALLAA
jgi:hypothetical protein